MSSFSKRLKDGDIVIGRFYLVNDDSGEQPLDGELVRDVRRLCAAAVQQLKDIPRDGKPLKRLPSPQGPTWDDLKQKVASFKFENAENHTESFFAKAQEGSSVAFSDPEGAEATEASAQPTINIEPEGTKKKKKPKQQSVDKPPQKHKRDDSPPSPGGGGSRKIGLRPRNHVAQGRSSAARSNATNAGGQRGGGTKTRKSPVQSAIINPVVTGAYGDDDLVTTGEYDPLTPPDLQNIDDIHEVTAREKVHHGYSDLATTDYNALTAFNLQNIQENVPKLTASGLMEDDIIDEEDNVSLDRAPSEVYEYYWEGFLLGHDEKLRAFNTKVQYLGARSIHRQLGTTFVNANIRVCNNCIEESMNKFVES
ncbi:hypothetical protein IAR50_004532 [Cryptococcus sp. DSM 104548]